MTDSKPKKKKNSVKIVFKVMGISMSILGAAFIFFALFHPEMSFPWSNAISYLIYGFYLAVAVLLLIAPVNKK